MADQNVTELTQLTEAQLLASILLYGVADPAGTPLDRNIPVSQLLGEYYKINVSVASNNLTVKLTHLDGTDPTTTNPLLFKIGDIWQVVTASLTFTLNAGTNWCNLGSSEMAALNHDVFMYVIEESGAAAGTKIGFSRLPYATTMGEFTNTNTSQMYIAGGWTNYTSTDPVRNIGRIRIQLSAAASHNWSVPSPKVVNYPIFETAWLNWLPTQAGFSANPTDMEHRYKLIYNSVNILERQNTSGTSNSSAFTFTAPFTAKNVTMSSGSFTWNSCGTVYDNGTAQANPGLVRITANTNVVDVFKDMAVTGFTASGGKRLSNMNVLVYEIG